jgi:hypothetical protein
VQEASSWSEDTTHHHTHTSSLLVLSHAAPVSLIYLVSHLLLVSQIAIAIASVADVWVRVRGSRGGPKLLVYEALSY